MSHSTSQPSSAALGVLKWRVLPMGVKVCPQVFQRILAHMLRQCTDSGPYIDDVLSSTGLPPPPPESGKGELEDSFPYQDNFWVWAGHHIAS